MRALLFVVLVAPLLLAGVHAQSPTDFYVNVVSARSVGCSPDSFTQPDLRVLVYLDDAPILTTQKAQDVREPLYADIVRVRAALPARVTIEVQEAEPAGLFGTSWVDCDVASGAATRFTYTYSGGEADEVRALGDGDRAAEATLVVGTKAPPAPVALATNLTSTSATITWDDAPAAKGHRLGADAPVPPALVVGADVRGATLAQLCDNEPYTLRVIRDAGAWRVASNVTFRTPNAAPVAPRVLSAPRENGNATVEWEAPDVHDAARFEILVGAGADPMSVRATVPVGEVGFARFTQVIALQPGDANVRVRLVDEGNLSSASPTFPLDATAQDASGAFPRACSFEATALAGATRTVATTVATPTLTTTTPTPPTGATAPTPATSATGASETRDGGGLLPNWAILVLIALVGVLLGAVIVLLARR